MQDLTLDFDTKSIINDWQAGEELVIQRIRLAIQCWCGDWFLDSGFGVPYDRRLGTRAMLVADIEEVIRGVDGVKDVQEVKCKTVKEDGQRVYKIEAKVSTYYNNTVLVDGLVNFIAV